jgi:hypothetical protein
MYIVKIGSQQKKKSVNVGLCCQKILRLLPQFPAYIYKIDWDIWDWRYIREKTGHLQLVTLACGPGLGYDPHGTLLNVLACQVPKRNKMPQMGKLKKRSGWQPECPWGCFCAWIPWSHPKTEGGLIVFSLRKASEPPLAGARHRFAYRERNVCSGPIAARLLFFSQRHHIWRATKLALGWSNSGKILVSSSTENLSDYQGYTCISSWHAVVTIDT